MNRMVQFLKHVGASISRVKQGKASIEDKVLLSALIIAVALILLAVVTIRYWIVPLLGIGFLGYLIYEQRPKALPRPIFNLIESIYRELFWVLTEVHSRVGAMRPLDPYDIVMTPPVAIRNGIEVVKSKVAKAKRGNCDSDELRLIGKIVQARINDRLRAGLVENIPFASMDGQFPLFYVDRVYDDVATLYLDLIVVDTDDKLRYVINSQFANSEPPPPEPTDEDF